MIELTQVGKRFHEGQPNEVVAVRDVNLQLQQGCVTVLQGASGSGKTTPVSYTHLRPAQPAGFAADAR